MMTPLALPTRIGATTVEARVIGETHSKQPRIFRLW